MSVRIRNNKINMTRGDTLIAAVDMNKDGVRYTPSDGDYIRFAVKHKQMTTGKTAYVDSSPLILKEIPTTTMLLELEPNDTKRLSFGEYVYDVEITFANGRVDTFITNSPFIIEPEVH